MDPVALLNGLLSQATVGIPLLVLLVALLVWTLAAPRIYPPIFTPRPVLRPMPPDPVSGNYWALTMGEWSTPVGGLYYRFVAAMRARYGVAPWEIPRRKSRLRKLGITDRKALLKLDLSLLRIYNEALDIERRGPVSFFGTAVWEHRLRRHRQKLANVVDALAQRMPEIWGE